MMHTPSINTEVINNTHKRNNSENEAPTSTKSTTSQKGNKSTFSTQPLSPLINIGNADNNGNHQHHHQLASAAARYKDQNFQLNLEIQSLKQRLSLTSSTSKNELLDLLSEKDSVIGNKSRQISALNDKFTKITKAVNGMEREMNILRKGKKEADDECKKINRYLGIREKEVNVLVARCATQEEKLNEMKSARMLEKELSSLKKKMDRQMDDHGKEIQGLMRDLQQVGNEKQKVQHELQSLRERNSTVLSELEGSKNDLKEKRDKISNLYDELKELHETKERESTECIAMRKELLDIKNANFEYESEIDELKTKHRNEFNQLRKSTEEEKRNDEQSLAELSSTKESEIESLRKESKAKQIELDHTIEDLNHLERQYEASQKEINDLKQNQDELSAVTKEEAEANEDERMYLEKQLTHKTKEGGELSKLNNNLKEEIESNAIKMMKLKEKIGFLEEKIREMTDKELDSMETQNQKMETIQKLEEELHQMEEEKKRIKKKCTGKIEDLELDAIEMQEELQNSIQEYEARISEINHELDNERIKAESYREELEQVQSNALKQEKLRKVEINLLEESFKNAKAQTKTKDEERLQMEEESKTMKKSYEESIAQLELRITEMQEEFEEGIQENEAKLIKTNKDLDAERIKVEAYKVELEKIEDHALKQDEILEAEINLLEESVKEAKAQTKNKENDIIKMEVENIKMKESFEEKMEEFMLEMTQMQQEAETESQTHLETINQINHDLDIEYTKAENYRVELEQLQSQTLKQDELRKTEIKLLEQNLDAFKEQSKKKEEEYHNSKDNQLNAARDRVMKLEEEVSEMKKVNEGMEMDAAMIVEELNKELVEASERHARLEEEKSIILNESKRAVTALEGKITSLETDFTVLKNELALRSTQLSQRDSTIINLTKAKKVQDQDVETWRSELDKLILAYQKCKIDHAAATKQLHDDYKQFKNKAQNDAAMFQKDYDTLQALASETEERFEEQTTELTKVKQALDEKARELREIAECQKKSEQELKEARNMIAELQDVSEAFNKQTDEYKSRYQNLQIEMEKELNSHLDEIERANFSREELEEKMEKMGQELKDVKAEMKGSEELRAMNFLLQDKVGRQEAFLKRKLEKEKKQRMVPIPLSHANNMGSPPRVNTLRSRSVTRRPVDSHQTQKVQNTQRSLSQIPQRPRGRSHSTNRRPPSPDELEDLLDDL